MSGKDVRRYISILQFPLRNHDALMEGKKSTPRCTENMVRDLLFQLGPLQLQLQQGKAACGHGGKAILFATWGICQRRAILRTLPKLCSVVQLVSRTTSGTLFVLKFDVWRSPRNRSPKGKTLFQEGEKNLFTTNQMELLISRKPQFL